VIRHSPRRPWDAGKNHRVPRRHYRVDVQRSEIGKSESRTGIRGGDIKADGLGLNKCPVILEYRKTLQGIHGLIERLANVLAGAGDLQ